MKVFTGRIDYRGSDALDVSVKSGDACFAPTWAMVIDWKKGKITNAQYTEMYYARMRESYRTNRSRWEEVLALPSVTLLCFCKKGTFCHRYLLADMLVKLGAERGTER
jgi:uncharacterized protein YeaO (DUF488 family)